MPPATSLPALPAPAAAANDATHDVIDAEFTDAPPTTPEPAVPSARLSPEQRRELAAIAEVIRCDVRQRVLLDLAAAGPANVGGLAARTAIDPNTLSHHLGKLRDLGLLVSGRKGKEIWYEAAPDRVRYERNAAGFTLQLTTRTTGITWPIHVPDP